ncbi:hypothetical protein [Pedobacter suwonensis]|uniref:hypothetical protein n=1 Tax=Pedobacter suwonensis TaxID=332999 RepID=UPI003C2F7524
MALITATAFRWGPGDGVVSQAVHVARQVLHQQPEPDRNVDLLVFAGIYRDDNLIEPATAALVQHGLALGLVHDPDEPPASPTLSFDLLNGSCSVLEAVATVRSFFLTGSARTALIVAADGFPVDGPPTPFTSAAGAFLLAAADPGIGFGPVHTRYEPKQASPLESYSDIHNSTTRILLDPDAADRTAARSSALALAAAEEHQLDLARLTLLLNAPVRGVAHKVARRLGISPHQVREAGPMPGLPHTAAPMLAYSQALAAGRVHSDRPHLFLSAGSGPSESCVLYRPI